MIGDDDDDAKERKLHQLLYPHLSLLGVRGAVAGADLLDIDTVGIVNRKERIQKVSLKRGFFC